MDSLTAVDVDTSVDFDTVRAGLAVLGEISVDIRRLIDGSTGLGGGGRERVAGLSEVQALVAARVRQAERQLERASLGRQPRVPVVLDPADLPVIQARQGQPMTPMVTRPVVATDGISSADVWMPPGHAAHAHVHRHTDIIVLVRDGEAVTLWWDHHGRLHEVRQRCGQHLHVPRGVPHAAVNLSSRPVLATEFRSRSFIDDDNHRLTELDPAVLARLRTDVA